MSRAAVESQGAEFAAICAAGLSPRLCGAYQARLPMATVFSWLSGTGTGTGAGRSKMTPPQPVVAPATDTRPLGTVTCSWWRKADAAHRLGMVQRIRHYATQPVSGSAPNTYGAGMSDTRASRLFEARCSTFEAGPFALYKIYGAAAPFSAVTR